MQQQTRIITETIDDYKADQWLWKRAGRVVQGEDPDATVFKVRGARIATCEPLVDLTVVDLGPARLVVVTAIEEGDLDADEYRPPVTFPARGGSRA